MAVAGSFYLAPDFSKTETVQSYAFTIVALAIKYCKWTIKDKKGQAVRFFNPLHVLDNKISLSDIDGLKIFKLYEHPEIARQARLGDENRSQEVPGSC